MLVLHLSVYSYVLNILDISFYTEEYSPSETFYIQIPILINNHKGQIVARWLSMVEHKINIQLSGSECARQNLW